MKYFIVAVGNKMPDWICAGYNEYIKRIPREISVNLIEVKPEKRVTGKTIEQLLLTESQRICSALPVNCKTVVLDERGHQWETNQFVQSMKEWTNDGGDVAFVIGGADGLHHEIKRKSHTMIALSRLTLPHGLVRILLAEQLYRAISIMKNHPYHRA